MRLSTEIISHIVNNWETRASTLRAAGGISCEGVMNGTDVPPGYVHDPFMHFWMPPQYQEISETKQ